MSGIRFKTIPSGRTGDLKSKEEWLNVIPLFAWKVFCFYEKLIDFKQFLLEFG